MRTYPKTSDAVADAEVAVIGDALTALQLIDNIVSGNEAQVDVVAPLPAGTNNIGDTDVLTVGGQTPTYGAGAADAGTRRMLLATDDVVAAALARSTSATLANVSGSASSVTLLASNAAAKGRAIFNDSAAALYAKFGATASTSSFTVKIAAGGYYEFPSPLYTGIVDGIWDSATGAARTTEW